WALIHIFLHPQIVITGVSRISSLNRSSCKIELKGMLGERFQGCQPKTTRSYLSRLVCQGCSWVGITSTDSGTVSKKTGTDQGKGKELWVLISRYSTSFPSAAMGRMKLSTIAFVWP